MTQEVDLCVIGGGSGGLSVAAGAAQLGLDTVLIEKDKMGGDCLNTGCVPSKALLAAAKSAQNFRTCNKYGLKAQEPDVDFSAVKDHVFSVIGAIEPHDSVERFEGLGVKVIKGAAKFTAPDTVIVNDQTVKSRHFVIATGSRAAIPPIKGLVPDKILTNETIFALREKPDHLVIIGGGPIGIEMAQAHRRLGCAVTVLDMGFMLPKDDPDLVKIVRQQLTDEGVTLLEGITVESVKHKDDGVCVFIKRNGLDEAITGSHLLVAAGRRVNVEGLELEKAGVAYGKRGITVDKRLRTSNKRIYAAGDVAGGPQFTHVAAYHAGIIIRNLIFKMPAKVDYTALPWVTYTDPELANVGMTEAMARETYGDDHITVVKWAFKENDRAQAEKRTEGMIKVVTDKKGRIRGAAIVGPGAGELIGIWGLAISQGLKMDAVAGTIAAYPTFGEASKRAAGAYYTESLFSNRTRKIVGWLQKLP